MLSASNMPVQQSIGCRSCLRNCPPPAVCNAKENLRTEARIMQSDRTAEPSALLCCASNHQTRCTPMPSEMTIAHLLLQTPNASRSAGRATALRISTTPSDIEPRWTGPLQRVVRRVHFAVALECSCVEAHKVSQCHSTNALARGAYLDTE